METRSFYKHVTSDLPKKASQQNVSAKSQRSNHHKADKTPVSELRPAEIKSSRPLIFAWVISDVIISTPPPRCCVQKQLYKLILSWPDQCMKEDLFVHKKWGAFFRCRKVMKHLSVTPSHLSQSHLSLSHLSRSHLHTSHTSQPITLRSHTSQSHL